MRRGDEDKKVGIRGVSDRSFDPKRRGAAKVNIALASESVV